MRDPITLIIPLLVKSTHELKMNHIATGKFLAKSNLSTVGQKLYDCISGKNFVLNDKDFPDFSKAIEIDPDDSKLYQGRAFAYRDYGMFKGQKNQKSYDRKKAINAFQFCVADFYKLKEISPGRKDMMSHLQEATECLKELKP